MELTEKEYTLRVWKMVFVTIVSVVAFWSAWGISTSLYHDRMALLMRAADTDETARATALARAKEAESLRDKAMFERSFRMGRTRRCRIGFTKRRIVWTQKPASAT